MKPTYFEKRKHKEANCMSVFKGLKNCLILLLCENVAGLKLKLFLKYYSKLRKAFE